MKNAFIYDIATLSGIALHQEIFSEWNQIVKPCWMKPNLDSNYVFSFDLAPLEICVDPNQSGKSELQPK